MFKKLNALIWLRNQVLMSNKNLLVQVVLPFLLLLMYKKFLGASGMELLYVCLPMAFAISVGSMISAVIAEEKEKNNLKTLLLSGVKYGEYIGSILVHPVLIIIIVLILFPIVAEVDLKNIYLEYAVVTSFTSLAVLLINMVVGLLSESQAKAQFNGLPISFMVALLPAFAGVNEQVQDIVGYSFMSAFVQFFNQTDFTLQHDSIKILIAWNIGLVLLTFWAVRKNKAIHESQKLTKFQMFKN